MYIEVVQKHVSLGDMFGHENNTAHTTYIHEDI